MARHQHTMSASLCKLMDTAGRGEVQPQVRLTSGWNCADDSSKRHQRTAASWPPLTSMPLAAARASGGPCTQAVQLSMMHTARSAWPRLLHPAGPACLPPLLLYCCRTC